MRKLLGCGVLAVLTLCGCASLSGHGPVVQRVPASVLLAYQRCDDKVLYYTFVEEVPTEAVKHAMPMGDVPSVSGLEDVISGAAAAVTEKAMLAFAEVMKEGYKVWHTTIGTSAELFVAGWDSLDDMQTLKEIVSELSVLSQTISYRSAVQTPAPAN